MKTWPLSRHILIAFALFLAVTGVFGAFTFSKFRTVRLFMDEVIGSAIPGIVAISEIQAIAQGNYILTLKHVQAADLESKKKLAGNIQANVLKIDQLTNLYAATIRLGGEREHFSRLLARRADYVTAFKQVITLSDAMRNTEAKAIVDERLEPAYQEFMHEINDRVSFNRKDGRSAGGHITLAMKSARHGFWAALGVALAAGILVTVFLLRSASRVRREISARIAAEERLRASEKLAGVAQMAARIAHEINNPLGGIKNCFHLLKPAIPPEDQRVRYLPMIEGEIDRITRILSEMFNLYRPEVEKPRAFHLNGVVKRVVELSAVRSQNARTRVEIHAPEEIHLVQQEGSVIQVLFNLLGNAIDVSPRDGTISIHLTGGGGMIRIAVKDEGPGVPEDLREKIFEPFFTTNHGRGGGVGLGLPISRSLAETMGGTLECENSGAKGACFVLQIPVGQGS
jgi:signal transduction histidine kinase